MALPGRYPQKGRVITWGDKIAASQKTPEYKQRHGPTMHCEKCGKKFRAYVGHQRWCSWSCRYQNSYLDKTGIERKAIVVGANLIMGKGKKQWIMDQIAAHVGTACKYCGITLSLENLTFDHKEPYGKIETRRQKAENRTTRMRLDAPSNLHVICQPCNQVKGAMRLDDFESMLEWARSRDPEVEQLLRIRLKRAQVFKAY